jgi:hypothetical protein
MSVVPRLLPFYYQFCATKLLWAQGKDGAAGRNNMFKTVHVKNSLKEAWTELQ